MQPPADGLATDVELITPQHPQGDDFAAPAAAEETKVPRDFATDQVDDDSHPCGTEAAGAARLVPGHGFRSFLVKPFDPSINGSGAAEQERCDSRPGVAIGQQQKDVSGSGPRGRGPCDIDRATPGVAGRRGSRYKSWVQVPEVRIELFYPIVQTSSTFPVAWIDSDLPCLEHPCESLDSVSIGHDALTVSPLPRRPLINDSHALIVLWANMTATMPSSATTRLVS